MEEIKEASEKAQEIIDKTEASRSIIKKMMQIVKNFIQKHRVICYGGTAINNLLPKEKQFYNPEVDIPDYDFFSEKPQEHSKQIADELFKAGIPNIEVKPGMHLETFKVFGDYTGVADVSGMKHEVFKALWKESIVKDGIHYAPPNFLRMSVYLELSRPRGFVERWPKVYKRLNLLNEEYPIKCSQEDKDFHDEIIDDELTKKIEVFLKKENVILLGFNAFNQQQSKKSWILPLDLLVTPERHEHVVENLLKIFDTTHRKDFEEYAELLPAHTDILKKNKLVSRIYETDACHSYHLLDNKMKIASIPTLLNFLFAMLYSDYEFIEHTSKTRIICTTQELVDMANNSGKRRFKLLTPIDCSGKQQDLSDMKKIRNELFTKLSTKRNSREFLKYFFTYIPKKHIKGSGHINTMFPKKTGLDYSKLKMTSEGEYSITKHFDSTKIIEIMKKYMKLKTLKNKTIADLSGNVGGDTIRFGMNFKEVDSYELNPENFEALKNNVEVYDLKNIKLHQGDSTILFNKKVDVLYIDPPWGGPEYKEKEKLILKFGKKSLHEYLESIIKEEWKPNYIFLKLPSNYDFNSFKNFNYEEFKIRKFSLIGIHIP